MEKKFKVQPPMMPNFISFQQAPGKREDGFVPDKNKLHISTLSDSEAISMVNTLNKSKDPLTGMFFNLKVNP